jgi:hypothetical protein
MIRWLGVGPAGWTMQIQEMPVQELSGQKRISQPPDRLPVSAILETARSGNRASIAILSFRPKGEIFSSFNFHA